MTPATLALPATANLAVAADLAERLGAELDGLLRNGGGALQVDASALQVYDTSTLALLLHLRRRALAAGRSLVLKGAPANLLQLADLYGVAGLVSTEGAQSNPTA